MTDYYVDKTNGDDGNAGTSTGAPFEHVQAAFDVCSPGDTIHIANTSAQTGTWDMSGITQDVVSAVHIKAWDNGGSITADLADGSTVTAWEYDGQSTATRLTVVGLCLLERGKIHSFDDTVAVTTSGSYVEIVDSEIYGTTSGSNTDGVLDLNGNGHIADNVHIHTVGSGTSGIICDQQAEVANCCVDGGGTAAIGINAYTSNTNSTITRNVIFDCTTGIETNDPSIGVHGNTIDSCTNGIRISSNNRGCKVTRNLVTSCTTGLDIVGIRHTAIGPNAFYDCTTDVDAGTNGIEYGTNIVESSDPYADSASHDYRIVSTADIASEPTIFGAKPIVSSGSGGNTSKTLRLGNRLHQAGITLS